MTPTDALAEVPAPVALLLAEYLSSMYGPEPDPLAHLACYAPGALLLVGDRVEKRQDVREQDYVEALEAALAARAASKRRGWRVFPVFELLEAVSCQAAEDVAAIRAVVRERRSGRNLDAVFVIEDGGVLGACLLEAPGELEAQGGRDGFWPRPYLAQAMVAAEFAQPPSGSGTDSCLTGLELSFDRLWGGTLSAACQRGLDREPGPPYALLPSTAGDIPLRSLPEARFSCAMCGESCRAGKWRNAVSDATRLALEAMPWHRTHPGRLPEVRFVAPEGENAQTWRGDVELAARPDGFCAFFDDERGCLIHGLLGRQPIPSCHQFPFAFTRTPDGLDVWTTFHCGAALDGHGSPLADREADIRSRLWAARTPQRWVGREVSLKGGLAVPWPTYRAIEAALLEFLAPDDPSPLAPSLHAAERFMQAVLDHPAGILTETAVAEARGRWHGAPRLSRPPGGMPDPLVAGLVVGLYRRYPQPGSRLELSDRAIGEALEALPPASWDWPEPLLKRYLRHAIFHKQFLQAEGGLFTWRVALLSYAVVRLYARSLAAFEREGRIRLVPTSGEREPVRLAGRVAEPAALPYLRKAIQDTDRLVIHAGTSFARFLKGHPAEYDRLLQPAIAPSLIWS